MSVYSPSAPSCTSRVDAAPAAVPAAASGPLREVVGGDLAAPLVTGGHRRYANLDYAASAPALRSVAEQVAAALPYYSSVHRGAGHASQVSTALYEGARAVIGEFLGARPDDVTVIVRNTTDALNLLASAVPAGGEVLFLDLEHHANLLPWQERGDRCLTAEPTLAATLRLIEAELAARPVALLAVTGCSNVTGEVLPVAELAALAHAHGARIAVDAAQLAPHRRVDLAALDLDYLALSGHKLYAPYGAGVLVGRRDWLDAAPPHLAGGGAVRKVSTDSAAWAAAPQRHEAGTPNVLGAVALAAACRALAELPEGALARHEEALRGRLVAGLADLPEVRVLSAFEDAGDRIGVVSFTVAGFEPGWVAAYLSAEHGIGVRDGSFCAHPLLDRLNGGRGAIRASFGIGSRAEDVDRLLAALRQLLELGEGWTYAEVEGRWTPCPDPRPAAADLAAGLLGGTVHREEFGALGASPCGRG